MEKKRMAQIVVPIVMVGVVASIWLFKNTTTKSEVDGTLAFPLEITGVDLEGLKVHEMPVIIDFGADECVPCKEMAPVLEKLNKEMQERAIIQFVDVWQYPDAARDFPVQVIPTQLFVNADGTPYVPSDEVANLIPFSMYGDRETGELVYTMHQGGLTEEQMYLIIQDMEGIQ